MLVPHELRECVLFVGIRQGDKFLPRATGFVVIINDQGYEWTYLVTAEHVVSGLLARGHEIYVRFNRKDGGTVASGPIRSDVWFYHPTKGTELQTDVAIAPFRPREDELMGAIDLNGDHSIAGTADVVKQLSIGPGEEIAVIGLFRTHHERISTLL
jgi:hypothetical protein